MWDVLNTVLTVVIPVKNEEKNLPQCLDCVKGIKHVVVVDSASTDETCSIAVKAGREVVQFKWNGTFPKKRNWILRNYQFKTPWVMFLDADEFPKDDFWRELEHVLPDTQCVGFWVGYDIWFLGRILRHGVHARKTALVKIGCGEYEKIDEQRWSKLDMEIHEHLIFNGPVGSIKTRIEHHDKKSLAAYYDRHNAYSSWEAERSQRITDYSILTFKQRVKYFFMRSKVYPIFYFIAFYVLKLGFLDGQPGFFFAIGKVCQLYHIRAKVYEVEHRDEFK